MEEKIKKYLEDRIDELVTLLKNGHFKDEEGLIDSINELMLVLELFDENHENTIQ